MFDGEDGERFKNLMIFHFLGTDKEMEEVAPIGCVIVIIVVLIFLGIWLFS